MDRLGFEIRRVANKLKEYRVVKENKVETQSLPLTLDEPRKRCCSDYRKYIVVISVLLGLVLLQSWCHSTNLCRCDRWMASQPDFTKAIDGSKIKEYLHEFTRKPHTAGTPNNKEVADKIVEIWKNIGLEDVKQIPYDVLLSYPVWVHPNKIYIKKDGATVFESSGMSPPLVKDEQSHKHAGIQWLAYSPPGEVTADVVYCNHGLNSEFEELKKLGVNLKGKIALIRYGTEFRGNLVMAAQRNGAAGVILYSDPAEVAPEGTEDEKTFPHTIWMPRDGVQRGSVSHGMRGDPLTPLYPSKKDIFKYLTIDQAKKNEILPSIPVLPAPYSVANEILSRMSGPAAPTGWQGGLNLTYRLGPGMNDNQKLTIKVNADYRTKTIQNVVGYIRGAIEPDRYVILGNHYDAWVYGSLDPNSGTAIMTELARTMVEAKNKTNWKPARTVMFAAWDAEEYGLLGSTEFVEEFLNILQQRAVIYINVDCIHDNRTLNLATIPSVQKVAMDAAKKIPNPNKEERDLGRNSIFDTWLHYFPSATKPGVPQIPIPAGNSDQATFQNFAGIPVIDFSFKNGSYPLYHTLYETPFLNEQLYDRDNFSTHRATAQLWGEIALQFIDSEVLPFNLTDLATAISEDYVPELEKALKAIPDEYQKYLGDALCQVGSLQIASKEFLCATAGFQSESCKTCNERLMNVERCFINPRGMPGAPHSRHVLYSVSDSDTYSSRVMAAVYDAISCFTKANDSERQQAARELAQQISIVQYSIQCATSTLADRI